MSLKAITLFFLSAVAANANCAIGEQTFMSCQIEGQDKWVSVCYNDDFATYRYGPRNGPVELALTATIADLQYHPWSGVGRDIGEGVTFHNGDYSYEVAGGFSRPVEGDEGQTVDADLQTSQFGWVSVTKNSEQIALLVCAPDTVTFTFGGGIYDLKVGLGYDWDYGTRRWVKTLE